MKNEKTASKRVLANLSSCSRQLVLCIALIVSLVLSFTLAGCVKEQPPATKTDEEILAEINSALLFSDYTEELCFSSSVARIFVNPEIKSINVHGIDHSLDMEYPMWTEDVETFNNHEYDVVSISHYAFLTHPNGNEYRYVKVSYYSYENVISSNPNERILVYNRYTILPIDVLSIQLCRQY